MMTGAVNEPEVLRVLPGERKVRLDLRVPRDLSWFDGHFPGCPLLPGVIQVTWALQFARQHLGIGLRFQRLSALKFMRFILPGSEVALLLEFDARRQQLSFEYLQEEAVCAAGTVGFETAP